MACTFRWTTSMASWPKATCYRILKSHHNQRNRGNLMTWWYFEFLCQKQRIPIWIPYQKSSKNIGKTLWEDYHVIRQIHQVLSPIPLRGKLGKVGAFSASSFSRVKLERSGWVGGEHYLQQLRHKSHIFHWEMHDNLFKFLHCWEKLQQNSQQKSSSNIFSKTTLEGMQDWCNNLNPLRLSCNSLASSPALSSRNLVKIRHTCTASQHPNRHLWDSQKGKITDL